MWWVVGVGWWEDAWMRGGGCECGCLVFVDCGDVRAPVVFGSLWGMGVWGSCVGATPFFTRRLG